MPWTVTSDGFRLHVEDTAEGTAIVFVHEFGGDQRSWELQVCYFSRRYRCVTFNARGYTPSDVPTEVEHYSQARAVEDIRDVMDSLSISKAHVVGLSMGGFAALHFGMMYPDRALSLVVGSTGYGAEREFSDYFRQMSHEVATQFETLGSEKYSHIYGMAAPRIPFLVKDPRGWEEFRTILSDRSAEGSAHTMRGVQAARPSIFDLEDTLSRMTVPTLIVVGDEDDHCLQAGLFMKRTIPASGLHVMPKTGHTCNLEEPDQFNRSLSEFFAMVEAGRWLSRDPRSRPSEIMKIS